MVNRLENNYKDTSSAPIDYSKIKVLTEKAFTYTY